ncbi:peptide IlvX [Citrobacter farmeri]|nr:peptide IlvX [Citrobacter farmeri]MBU5646852.1 peptide IlvX [Pluralibacter sp. S54_ASV_43]HBC0515151.1 hypothetical protein [Citrobacter freundii]EHK0947204.1 hypothetical protein [Citrobacter farmeri]EKU0082207.1 hypothetical protein [Citrobacter farmeri]EKV7300821.1 hypothetical protein [Citrobacter farmeri]
MNNSIKFCFLRFMTGI